MGTHIKIEFDHNQYCSTVCSNEAYSVLAVGKEHVNSFVDEGGTCEQFCEPNYTVAEAYHFAKTERSWVQFLIVLL